MNSDEKFQELFAEMRATDRKNAPSFQRMVHPANFRKDPARSFPVLGLSLATAAAIVVSALLVLNSPHPRETVPESWSSISDWSASTDSLLTQSETFSSSSLTTPSDSWLEDINSSSPEASATHENL